MLDTRIGVDLFIVNRALEERAYDAVAAAGIDDITMAQARLLARVGPEGTRLGELADRARITKQTAGHLVDQLERAGYAVRTPDPDDGRARLVRLTERAEAVVPVANAAVVEALGEWEQLLGAEAMTALADALSRLAEVSDPFASGA